jgi:tripartite-type tricarboxylate transporter receptor subunit TctC
MAITAIAALAAPRIASVCLAADYPERSISLVVPAPVGGTTDTLCRVVADKLREAFGKPTVVENSPSGVGSIGASVVAAARPDGHNLLCTPDGRDRIVMSS